MVVILIYSEFGNHHRLKYFLNYQETIILFTSLLNDRQFIFVVDQFY